MKYTATNTTKVNTESKSQFYMKTQKIAKLNFWQKILFNIFLVVLFSGLIYVLVYPVLYVISTSFKSIGDMLDPTTVWLAKEPTASTYKQAYTAIHYMDGFKNSFFISIGASLLQLASCSIIGYGFARFKFKEKGLIFGLIILTLIVPPQTIMIPQFIMYKEFDVFGIFHMLGGNGLNFLDSYVPFMLPAIFGFGLKSGLFIYIFRQFFRGMPQELEEAAYIDGCGPFRTYLKVMFPNAVPAITTVMLFSFVWHWNDVFEPTMFITNPTKYPLSLRLIGIAGYISKGVKVTDLTEVIPIKYAGIALALLPMFILYLFGQKYFVESVERSGIVG